MERRNLKTKLRLKISNQKVVYSCFSKRLVVFAVDQTKHFGLWQCLNSYLTEDLLPNFVEVQYLCTCHMCRLTCLIPCVLC